jgi:sugar phosphate isomerase/epimerase
VQDSMYSPGATAPEGAVPVAKPFPLAMQVYGEEGMRDLPRLAALGMSVELADFFPVAMWQGDFMFHARRWAEALHAFPGGKCLHGAFYDLKPSANEPDVLALTRTRHRQSLEVAATIGCDMMIVHSDFPSWEPEPLAKRALVARLVEYFGALAADAAPYGVTIVIENILDRNPRQLADIARAIDAPNLGLSLDVGHAHLSAPLPLDRWVSEMQPYLRHVHLHDNDGVHDRHWAMGDGNMIYRSFFEAVTTIENPPRVTVEVLLRNGAWRTVDALIAQGWYHPPEGHIAALERIS